MCVSSVRVCYDIDMVLRAASVEIAVLSVTYCDGDKASKYIRCARCEVSLCVRVWAHSVLRVWIVCRTGAGCAALCLAFVVLYLSRACAVPYTARTVERIDFGKCGISVADYIFLHICLGIYYTIYDIFYLA